jgi:hypothetical protein
VTKFDPGTKTHEKKGQDQMGLINNTWTFQLLTCLHEQLRRLGWLFHYQWKMVVNCGMQISQDCFVVQKVNPNVVNVLQYLSSQIHGYRCEADAGTINDCSF